ncbi:immune-type receptor 7b [Desulfitobacterium metallireducens DSM 15288]|uniref:Immune-type receptor 7b n=1 Tax=Desulfitobacterium metallireducens DSM 15288 TaxID=871968 RepID=W0E582_9FIRM|nr:immune-type receptor 7b [Desulfitobacterium metallireducens DSM 15288]
MSTVIPLLAGIFVIYFLISVMKFMKKKIKLDEQRIEQTNQFLELYKSTKDIN